MCTSFVTAERRKQIGLSLGAAFIHRRGRKDCREKMQNSAFFALSAVNQAKVLTKRTCRQVTKQYGAVVPHQLGSKESRSCKGKRQAFLAVRLCSGAPCSRALNEPPRIHMVVIASAHLACFLRQSFRWCHIVAATATLPPLQVRTPHQKAPKEGERLSQAAAGHQAQFQAAQRGQAPLPEVQTCARVDARSPPVEETLFQAPCTAPK